MTTTLPGPCVTPRLLYFAAVSACHSLSAHARNLERANEALSPRSIHEYYSVIQVERLVIGLEWTEVEVLTGLFGALVGALVTWLLGRNSERQRRRYEVTTEIASTFHSPNFMHHRVGMWQLGEAVVANETTMASIACGFWYPGKGSYYEGPDCYGLTLHGHLSIYIDWLSRVGYAIRTGLADSEGLRAQLEGNLIWYAWFIENLLTEIYRQTLDNQVPAPGWIELVRLAQKEIVGEVPTEPAQATLRRMSSKSLPHQPDKPRMGG